MLLDRIRRFELVFSGLAVLTIMAGVAWGVVVCVFYASAAKADGQVVELRELPERPAEEATYAPVFVFTDKLGVSHRIVSNISSNPSTWSVGDRLRVAYAENDPENCLVDSFVYVWLPPLMPVIIGLSQLLFCRLVLRYVSARTKRKSSHSGIK